MREGRLDRVRLGHGEGATQPLEAGALVGPDVEVSLTRPSGLLAQQPFEQRPGGLEVPGAPPASMSSARRSTSCAYIGEPSEAQARACSRKWPETRASTAG
ncbi:MAG TPA: hypothetical protein VFJ83_01245 [Nocardioidaceae bacterium]|nr:hypothetical protein [Nocardioidaceae bacterium]